MKTTKSTVSNSSPVTEVSPQAPVDSGAAQARNNELSTLADFFSPPVVATSVDDIARIQSNDPMLYVIGAGAPQGGVGKTSTLAELIAWYLSRGHATTKIDLDESVKNKGSLKSFFPDVVKAPLSENVGLNMLLRAVSWEPRRVVVDSGASTTRQTIDWFDRIYDVLTRRGHRFLVVGVVTPDFASVEGFLAYGALLQYRADYLVVQNETTYKAKSAWQQHPKTAKFVELFNPKVITMPYRDQELARLLRQHSLTVARVAQRAHDVPVLHDSLYQILAEALHLEITKQFDSVADVLLK